VTAETFVKLVTALTAVVGAVVALLQIIRSRRDKIAAVRQSFDAVVKSLASTVEVERISGAILLRRFYDATTEAGIGGRPYWKEAVNVSAAILRSQATGNFQKLLSDGLAFAPDLVRADLQRTNLQFAYLGSRDTEEGKRRTNLYRADFYRADLSRASLKEANAEEAVFYEARLHDTVFIRAILRNANFFEADLSGARFDGAILEGAKFKGARNVPAAIASKLNDERIYATAEPCASTASPASSSGRLDVFLSKLGCMSA